MSNSIKLSKTFLTINGKRRGIYITAGPWVAGVNPETIKLTPKRGSFFPREFEAALAIENKSDGMTDYFESDSIRLLPEHSLHAAAKGFAAELDAELRKRLA